MIKWCKTRSSGDRATNSVVIASDFSKIEPILAHPNLSSFWRSEEENTTLLCYFSILKKPYFGRFPCSRAGFEPGSWGTFYTNEVCYHSTLLKIQDVEKNFNYFWNRMCVFLKGCFDMYFLLLHLSKDLNVVKHFGFWQLSLEWSYLTQTSSLECTVCHFTIILNKKILNQQKYF